MTVLFKIVGVLFLLFSIMFVLITVEESFLGGRRRRRLERRARPEPTPGASPSMQATPRSHSH